MSSRNQKNVKFSLAAYSEAEQRDIVAILRPFVGRYMGNTDEELVSYLKQHGVDDVSGADARYFALTAAKENLALAKQRGREKRDRWILVLIDFHATS